MVEARTRQKQKLKHTLCSRLLQLAPSAALPDAAQSGAAAAPAVAPAGYKYVNKQQSCQSEMMLQSELDCS